MKIRLTLILFILIILLAAYLRLYKIDDYMTFLGDEGRDVLVAKEMLEGNLTLLGPRSSAGDFFMGPAYYYMITPWLWLFRYDPVGPAVMVAVFGIATVFLIYYAGKKWFGEKAGLFAAALYSVAPIIITYSHSSWNPNPLPFFSLLTIFLLFKAITENKGTKYFIGVGFLLGIALQLHYLALFLIVIAFSYALLGKLYIDKSFKIKSILRRWIEMLIGFVIGFSPFLAFEVRHGFPNIKTIFSFIFSDTLQQKGYESGATFFSTITDVFFRIFAKLVFYFPSPDKYYLFPSQQLDYFYWLVMITTIMAIVGLFFIKNKSVLIPVCLWLFLGIFFFGFYKKQIYDYHFAFLFPLPFLIIGNFLSQIFSWGRNNVQKIVAVILSVGLFAGIFVYNYSGRPFKHIPNRQKEQVKLIARAVIEHTDNKPYNFALITKGNSDHAYRYFLEILGHPPVTLENTLVDPERKSVTKQLLIVCEDVECKPLGHSLFEVSGFGRAEIAGEWKVSVVKVFKLVPYKDQ